MLLTGIVTVSFAVLLWLTLTRPTAQPHEVYARPGFLFSLKRLLFLVLLKLRNRKNVSEKGNSQDKGGYGKKSFFSVADMERPQILEEHPQAIDTAYFTSVGKDGTVFVLRIARRHNRQAELWMSLKIPGVGFLQSPIHPDTACYNLDGESFSAGGLRFECIEPMRRWRVLFNGLLRKGLWNDFEEKDEGETVHVKFSFVWEAFSDVFDFDTDIDPGSLADAIAREKWTKEFWKNLRGKHQTHYEQWGEMLGTFWLEGHEERQLRLKCMRDHSYGIRDWRDFYRYIVHFCYLDDGTAFHLSTISLPVTMSYLKIGYVALPCGVMLPVTSSNLELTAVGEDGTPPKKYSFTFKAGKMLCNVQVNVEETPRYFHHENWSSTIHECMCSVTVNGIKGWGIAEYVYRYDAGSPVPIQTSLVQLKEHTFSAYDRSELLLPFSDPRCTSSKLVGGKGCQLALLTQLHSQDFKVPSGFCLSIASFELQMEASPELRKTVQDLAAICSGRKQGHLQAACEMAVEHFQSAQIHAEIRSCLLSELTNQFGDAGYEETLLAVRSSAVGEDGAEMSAAGQMETVLGVKGLDKLYSAVCKCWASFYAFQAVEYRRQHGQPIVACMAVVIQEMVPSEVSGVLFTQDPLTQNPGIVSINANFGLGESVVSGSCEPDTLQVARTWDDRLSIQNIVLGKKSRHVTLKDEGGVEEIDASDASQTCCLPGQLGVRLATIGVQLEKHFGSPRDIEWAVRNQTVYILQARPITTLGGESEWHLMHEFDTPLASDAEALTTCNIGEMMPGAMTPLTISTFYRAIEFAFQDMLKTAGVLKKHYDLHKFMAIESNTPFLNMHYTYGITDVHVLNNKKRMAELSLMGEALDEVTEDNVRSFWGESPFYRKVLNAIRMFRMLRGAYKKTKRWEALASSYSLGDHSDAHSLYSVIDEKMPEYRQIWTDTFHNSASSGTWATVLLSVLSQGKPNWTTQHMSDVAMLLSKCEGVYSADVPSALQGLAKSVQDSDKATHLTQLTPEQAVAWLQSPESGTAGASFAQFLVKHGHRCIREAEIFEKSWKSEPVKVVRVLQAMLQTPLPATEERQVEDIDVSIRKLKSKTTLVGRKVLQWALPEARRAVGRREWGKSICVQLSDVFKEAYWKLAHCMVGEGYLPQKELLFFLTHKEIGDVLKHRSGKLIARAQRRRRLLSKQSSMKFPRLSFGHPVPIEEVPRERSSNTSVRLTGMPVSQGRVQGKCRVVLSLQDAASIQVGDILVVNYTDVGWSPYFPMLSGLVTEIGGLLSHGAVVAREYGLPCIVNVQSATTFLQTGDDVLLDGTNGTVEKVE